MRPDTRREMTALLDGLERSELPGDIGHMIYLALENAMDGREEVEAPRHGGPLWASLQWLRGASVSAWSRR